jgi:hypothetical protein
VALHPRCSTAYDGNASPFDPRCDGMTPVPAARAPMSLGPTLGHTHTHHGPRLALHSPMRLLHEGPPRRAPRVPGTRRSITVALSPWRPVTSPARFCIGGGGWQCTTTGTAATARRPCSPPSGRAGGASSPATRRTRVPRRARTEAAQWGAPRALVIDRLRKVVVGYRDSPPLATVIWPLTTVTSATERGAQRPATATGRYAPVTRTLQ